MSQNNQLLAHWARGPFELIQHADGHLKTGNDFDRRMALISFDNAIEITITTYLQLHPKQRNNETYTKQEIHDFIRNYHTKLEFYEKYINKNNLSTRNAIPEIIWYHSLRNELYHAGNGMVPEQKSVEGIRSAALEVFSILFNVDAESILKKSIPPPEPVLQKETLSIQTNFLRHVIEFEQFLKQKLTSGNTVNDKETMDLVLMWNKLQTNYDLPIENNESAIDIIQSAYNEIIHAGYTNIDENVLISLNSKMSHIIKMIETYLHKIPTWLTGNWIGFWYNKGDKTKRRDATLSIKSFDSNIVTMTVYYEKKGIKSIVEQELSMDISGNHIKLTGIKYKWIEKGIARLWNLDIFELIANQNKNRLEGKKHDKKSSAYEVYFEREK